MKVFEGKTKKGRYFTELVKIEDFTTIKECLKVINEHFLDEEDDDCPFYTDEEDGKNYTYCYVSDSGKVYFVESLNEFFDDRKTEEDWDVEIWSSIN